MKNKTCGECKYHIGTRCNLPKETFIIMPEIEACRHFTQKPKMTNGDRIRQMSDEELAKKLVYYKHVQKIIGEMGYSCVRFASTIIKNEEFETKPEAIAATIKELKKEYKK